MDELNILQAVRLKGRVSAADVAATLNQDPDAVAQAVTKLTESGLLVEGNRLKLSPDGRKRLNQLLTEERRDIDTDSISTAYNAFRGVNAEFKALVSDWQMKDGEPNGHGDAEYDAAVLTRLDSVHQTVLPIIGATAAQLPRLGAYADKLSAAMANIKAGDTSWLTRPIIDSYHTVWFQLHEELIVAAGLTREGEAKAGDAH